MNKINNIHDEEYISWLSELKSRYRNSQIKASINVNKELIKFYWSLGRDIVLKKAENKWGSKFFEVLSKDLRKLFPNCKGFSIRNLHYMKHFHLLFSKIENINYKENQIIPQLVVKNKKSEIPLHFSKEINKDEIVPQVVAKLENNKIEILPQVAAQLNENEKIFSLPWGQIRMIIDKCNDCSAAEFYLNEALKNGWSRSLLLNNISS